MQRRVSRDVRKCRTPWPASAINFTGDIPTSRHSPFFSCPLFPLVCFVLLCFVSSLGPRSVYPVCSPPPPHPLLFYFFISQGSLSDYFRAVGSLATTAGSFKNHYVWGNQSINERWSTFNGRLVAGATPHSGLRYVSDAMTYHQPLRDFRNSESFKTQDNRMIRAPDQ